jgi:hypothetical protein
MVQVYIVNWCFHFPVRWQAANGDEEMVLKVVVMKISFEWALFCHLLYVYTGTSNKLLDVPGLQNPE